jgi:hypothetical protein
LEENEEKSQSHSELLSEIEIRLYSIFIISYQQYVNIVMSLFLIDSRLEQPFKIIEDIIEKAQRPIVVRNAIAERFALIVPETIQEYLSNKINKASERGRSTSTSSSPISTPNRTPSRDPVSSLHHIPM